MENQCDITSKASVKDDSMADQRESLEFCGVDHISSAGSRVSHEDISLEECERLVLSPYPVPMNADVACEAINAAARRSNSSRTHSIKTLQLDSHGDAGSQLSDQDAHQLNVKKIEPPQFPTGHHLTSSSWRRLFCCFVGKSKTFRIGAKSHHKNGDAPCGSSRVVRNCKTVVDKNSKQPVTSDTSISPLTLHPTSVADTGDHQTVPSGPVAGRLISSPDPRVVDPATQTSTSSVSSTQGTRVYSSLTINFPRIPNFRRSSPNSSTTTDLPTANPDIGLTFSLATPKIQDVTPSATSLSTVTNRGELRHRHQQNDEEESTPGTTLPLSLPSWGADASDGSVGDIVTHHDYGGSSGCDASGYYAPCDSSSETLGPMTLGMNLLGEVPKGCINKKCLVLDLDETLVHSWFKYVENANFVVPVEIDGAKHQIYVCKRPHLDEFLHAVGPLFECVMFTASLRIYADPVCDYIDRAAYFKHRLFREACVHHQNNLIKDLSRLGRDIDQICIVDNSPVSFLFQPCNALQIVSWFDDPNDRALLELIPYLTGLAKSNTVVDYLRHYQPPASAAVAQPATPSWLLYYPSIGIGEHDDQGSGLVDPMDDMYGPYSEEEEAVLSPHFHPPPVISGAVHDRPQHHGHYHRVSAVPLPLSNSFVHQVAQPSETLRLPVGIATSSTTTANELTQESRG